MASILETFFLLIEWDTSGLKKGATEVEAIAKKTETSLSKTTQNITGQLKGLVSGYLSALTSAFSIGAFITGIKSAVEYADKLGVAAKQLHVGVQELDAWSSAVKRAGGTAEGFQNSLKSLAGNDYFQVLGRRLTGAKGKITNVISVLPRLASLFERLGSTKSGELGKKLGLDEATIMLLQKGRREVDSVISRQKELGLVTQQDAEQARKFNEQWEDTTRAFRSLFTVIGSMLLPVVSKLSKAFEDVAIYFRKHKDLIIGGLVAIGVVAAITGAILIGPFLFWGTVLAATIALFAILYEDIKAFNSGANSLLGDLVKKFPRLGEIIKELKLSFQILWDTIKAVGSASVEVFKEIGNQIALFIQDIIKAIDIVSKAYSAVKSFLGLGGDVNVTAAQKLITASGQTPFNTQSSNSIANNTANTTRTSNVQIGDINIQTQATDASGISNDINSLLKEQLRQTVGTFDDGVMI